jgi:hypothetical protein
VLGVRQKIMLIQNQWFGVEESGDPDVRVYHSRLRLLDEFANVQAMANMRQLVNTDGTPHELPAVVETLLSIKGVATVNVQAYIAVVRKSPLYDWREIDDDVLRLLGGVRLAMTIDDGLAE